MKYPKIKRIKSLIQRIGRKRRKQYERPVLGKHRPLRPLKELGEEWKALRQELRAMGKHINDFKISLGGISEKVRTYSPAEGKTGEAREKLNKIEAGADPLLREAIDLLTVARIKQGTLLATLEAILKHPGATQEQRGAAQEEVQRIEHERKSHAKILGDVERLRETPLKLRGQLMKRERLL